MSETLRTFEFDSTRRRRTGRGTRRGCTARILAVLILIAAVYVFWTTRDTCPIARLTPEDRQFRAFIHEPLQRKGRIASSAVWSVFPASSKLAELPHRLEKGTRMPGWMERHFVGPFVLITGNDVDQFSDVLILTRMTRIGCLLERLSAFADQVEKDAAGGLELRHLPDYEIYYAVRGRILALSPSRNALIRAVTLRAEDTPDPRLLDKAIEEAGPEDISGTIRFADERSPDYGCEEADVPGGRVLRSVAFALRIEPGGIELKTRAALKPEFKERVQQLFSGVEPRELNETKAGIATVTAHFDKSIRELWTTCGELLDNRASMDSMWQRWLTPPDKPDPGDMLACFLTTILGPMGPEVTLTWYGVDLNEMFPMPRLAAVLQSPANVGATVFESLPPVPEDALPWETFPRYDVEARRARLPMIGGPAIEPTACFVSDCMVAGTGTGAVREAIDIARNKRRPKAGTGNIYCHVHPGPCVQAVYDTAMLMADNGLLKGHTRDSVAELWQPWLDRADRIEEMTLVLGYDSGEITGEFKISCGSSTEKQAL